MVSLVRNSTVGLALCWDPLLPLHYLDRFCLEKTFIFICALEDKLEGTLFRHCVHT